MDARPSSEQRELADAADRLAQRLGPTTVGDLDDADRRQRLDSALAQAGWRELRTGSATEPLASGVEAALVARALSRRACDTGFIGPLLAHDLARRAGLDSSGQQRTIVVDAGLSGVAVSNRADDEPLTSTLEVSALAVDVAGCVSGVVTVETSTGASIAEVPLRSIQVGVDLTRPVSVIAAGTVAQGLAGSLRFDDIASWTALAVTLTSADLVGTMEGALELAIEYAKERRQFGAPIGTYQAVQHLLAEAKTLTEGALSATIHAAWAVDALDPNEALDAAAVAKAYASRAARTVCETAIQVHGGIGNTWECMAHVFLRRAMFATELFGGEGPQLARLANRRWGATNGFS